MRAFLYCRVAHDYGSCLKGQVTVLRDFADQEGYTIAGVSSEQGSGMAIDRPGLQEVTQAVLSGKVDVVLVAGMSRISRAWSVTKEYIDFLTANNVQLMCLKEHITFAKK